MTDQFNSFRLFLSASVPNKKRHGDYYAAFTTDIEKRLALEDVKQISYKDTAGNIKTVTKIPNAQLLIEEAVICLARAVFANKGQLVFGGHPSISPLVSVISEEYVDHDDETGDGAPGREIMQGSSYLFTETNCPPVVIYQSKIYQEDIPHESRQMLTQGHAFMRWTEEKEEDKSLDMTGKSAHPNSIAFMRDKMINENPLDAMVCIGGMDGVEREVELFIKRYEKSRPIFIFGSTGGASALMAVNNELKSRGWIEVIDEEHVKNGQGKNGLDQYGMFSTITYLASAHEIVKKLTS